MNQQVFAFVVVAGYEGFALGEIVVTMDDDLIRSTRLSIIGGKRKSEKITLEETVNNLVVALLTTGAYLAGSSNSTNPLFAKESVSRYGHIAGGIMVHRPSDLRFDESLTAAEDLDFGLRHHTVFGMSARDESLMPDFHMLGRSKKSDAEYAGGYDGYRDDSRLKIAAAMIADKYASVPEIVIEYVGLGVGIHKGTKFRALSNRVLLEREATR